MARTVVEPVGYAVTTFVGSVASVIGIGLAPDGLLLFAAAMILSVIDWRRMRAANPGLFPERPEDFEGPISKAMIRYSALGTLVLVVLSVAAYLLVAREDDWAAAIGPALIAGVFTLFFNWRLKIALQRAVGGPDDRHGLPRDEE